MGGCGCRCLRACGFHCFDPFAASPVVSWNVICQRKKKSAVYIRKKTSQQRLKSKTLFFGVMSIVSCLGPGLWLCLGRWTGTETVSGHVSSAMQPLPFHQSKTWSVASTASATSTAGRPSLRVRVGYGGTVRTSERRTEMKNWRRRNGWRTISVSWTNQNKYI